MAHTEASLASANRLLTAFLASFNSQPLKVYDVSKVTPAVLPWSAPTSPRAMTRSSERGLFSSLTGCSLKLWQMFQFSLPPFPAPKYFTARHDGTAVADNAACVALSYVFWVDHLGMAMLSCMHKNCLESSKKSAKKMKAWAELADKTVNVAKSTFCGDFVDELTDDDVCSNARDFILEPCMLMQLPWKPALLHQWLAAVLHEVLKFELHSLELKHWPLSQESVDLANALLDAVRTLKERAMLGFALLTELVQLHPQACDEKYADVILDVVVLPSIPTLELLLNGAPYTMVNTVKRMSWSQARSNVRTSDLHYANQSSYRLSPSLADLHADFPYNFHLWTQEVIPNLFPPLPFDATSLANKLNTTVWKDPTVRIDCAPVKQLSLDEKYLLGIVERSMRASHVEERIGLTVQAVTLVLERLPGVSEEQVRKKFSTAKGKKMAAEMFEKNSCDHLHNVMRHALMLHQAGKLLVNCHQHVSVAGQIIGQQLHVLEQEQLTRLVNLCALIFHVSPVVSVVEETQQQALGAGVTGPKLVSDDDGKLFDVDCSKVSQSHANVDIEPAKCDGNGVCQVPDEKNDGNGVCQVPDEKNDGNGVCQVPGEEMAQLSGSDDDGSCGGESDVDIGPPESDDSENGEETDPDFIVESDDSENGEETDRNFIVEDETSTLCKDFSLDVSRMSVQQMQGLLAQPALTRACLWQTMPRHWQFDVDDTYEIPGTCQDIHQVIRLLLAKIGAMLYSVNLCRYGNPRHYADWSFVQFVLPCLVRSLVEDPAVLKRAQDFCFFPLISSTVQCFERRHLAYQQDKECTLDVPKPRKIRSDDAQLCLYEEWSVLLKKAMTDINAVVRLLHTFTSGKSRMFRDKFKSFIKFLMAHFHHMYSAGNVPFRQVLDVFQPWYAFLFDFLCNVSLLLNEDYVLTKPGKPMPTFPALGQLFFSCEVAMEIAAACVMTAPYATADNPVPIAFGKTDFRFRSLILSHVMLEHRDIKTKDGKRVLRLEKDQLSAEIVELYQKLKSFRQGTEHVKATLIDALPMSTLFPEVKTAVQLYVEGKLTALEKMVPVFRGSQGHVQSPKTCRNCGKEESNKWVVCDKCVAQTYPDVNYYCGRRCREAWWKTEHMAEHLEFELGLSDFSHLAVSDEADDATDPTIVRPEDVRPRDGSDASADSDEEKSSTPEAGTQGSTGEGTATAVEGSTSLGTSTDGASLTSKCSGSVHPASSEANVTPQSSQAREKLNVKSDQKCVTKAPESAGKAMLSKSTSFANVPGNGNAKASAPKSGSAGSKSCGCSGEEVCVTQMCDGKVGHFSVSEKCSVMQAPGKPGSIRTVRKVRLRFTVTNKNQ